MSGGLFWNVGNDPGTLSLPAFPIDSELLRFELSVVCGLLHLSVGCRTTVTAEADLPAYLCDVAVCARLG